MVQCDIYIRRGVQWTWMTGGWKQKEKTEKYVNNATTEEVEEEEQVRGRESKRVNATTVRKEQ